jgi:hypothetical protein
MDTHGSRKKPLSQEYTCGHLTERAGKIYSRDSDEEPVCTKGTVVALSMWMIMGAPPLGDQRLKPSRLLAVLEWNDGVVVAVARDLTGNVAKDVGTFDDV